MKIFNRKTWLVFPVALLAFTACTKLEENLNSELSGTQVSGGATNPGSLLTGVYTSLRNPFEGPWGVWSLQEVSSDEVIIPTRGGDWDDGGDWRALHLHKWTSFHPRIYSTMKDLTGTTFAATDLLRYNPSAQQAAEARFLRALATFSIVDLFGQVPYREPGEDLTKPAKVRSASQATTWMIAELSEIIPSLPSATAAGTKPYTATKEAAKALLMKCYLNKGVFANRQSPTFDVADMQKVISLADEIIATGKYSLAVNYFDNFAPRNETLSTENIFTGHNIGGGDGSGAMNGFSFAPAHYNMNPGGWNGFSTLSDFYNKFTAADARRGGNYTGFTDVGGIKAGFNVGQQYNKDGVALKDRRGNNLAFTPEVSIIEKDINHLEVAGIRVWKYLIDYANINSPDNDWVYLRYADVLLMKAEALLRTNSPSAALTIVNDLRTVRGAATLAALTNDVMLDELGREFYWESHRRTDLIRFGKWLNAWQEKQASDVKYLLYPIPDTQLNTNLKQNPGY
ncbi:RagB/SusD family nutrient uptake outer membrane protein [Pedobacter sp.]